MKRLEKGIKIINCEAKDIKKGFSKFNGAGELATNKYKGNFDYSLCLLQLEKICRDKNIELYKEINGKLYSDALICVNFNYSLKEGEEGLYTYAEHGVTINGDICSNKTMMTTAELREDLYENGFEIKNNGEYDKLINCIKVNEKKIKLLENEERLKVKLDTISRYERELKKQKKQLEELGEDTIRYVRFVRSSGSSRIGKCLFIRGDLFEDIMSWLKCGLEINEGDEVDLASIEAYLSLTTSSIIDTMSIKSENILLVEDVYSRFKTRAMVTRLNNDGALETKEDEVEISNSLFDGASLIDHSLLDEEYNRNGGVQLRNRWFKGMAFSCNIQQFFKDNNITKIEQLNGKTIAKEISDIRFITTPSSIKYLKLGLFEKWIREIEDTWGICSTPHNPKFNEGKYVQSHYQLLNNLQLSEQEVKAVLKDTLDYINLLKNDLGVFKKHVGAKCGRLELEEESEEVDNTLKVQDSINDFILNLVSYNSNFARTKMFKEYRTDVIENYIENLKQGHVLIPGTYAVVINNSIDYLYHSIGKLDINNHKSNMKFESMMCSRFDYNKELLLSRSPMPVQGNIVISKNTFNKNIQKYFSYDGVIPNNIVHINAINTNIMERGSGFDCDGDKFLITDEITLLKCAKKNYDKFLVPVNKIVSNDKLKYTYRSKDKAILDVKTSKNNIGIIINHSMVLVSEYWDRLSKGESVEGLYELISELSIMSCVEIDSAKKVCPYNVDEALKKIESSKFFRKGEYFKKDKDGKNILDGNSDKTIKLGKVRPLFFMLVGGQNYRFEEFKCTMDILNRLLGTNISKNHQPNVRDRKNKSIVKPSIKTPTITLLDILIKDKIIGKESNRRIDKVVSLVKNYQVKVRAIRLNTSLNSKDKWLECIRAEEDYNQILSEQLSNITKADVLAIIKRLSKAEKDDKTNEYTKITRNLIHTTYKINKTQFLEMFKEDSIIELKKDRKGKKKIFGINYSEKEVSGFCA